MDNMKITWLGQAGLLFRNESINVLIDPYFSDSVSRINPYNYRRIPISDMCYEIKPDVLILTHDHLDHFDPDTLAPILHAEKKITVLSPSSVWSHIKKYGGSHNYVLFNRLTRWTERGVVFTAVKAIHSDEHAIGVIIDDGKKIYYVTGDTLYSDEIFRDLPNDIDVVFLPINGVGNNMNMEDATAFAKKCNSKYVVPIHFGMFDNIDPNDFMCDDCLIPTVYKELEFTKGESL